MNCPFCKKPYSEDKFFDHKDKCKLEFAQKHMNEESQKMLKDGLKT